MTSRTGHEANVWREGPAYRADGGTFKLKASRVVLTCGLPASGKTTAARRLHARAGGVLIRSCDVYQELGISLPDWVRRTRGFTADVGAYDQVRDRAYEVMARRLEASLPESSLVILDAVYGERAKRDAVYAICRSRGAAPTLLLCRCHDPGEVARRFEARRGQETIPEHEASDLCVFHDIARRWEDPLSDRWLDGGAPPAVLFDTLGGALSPLNSGGVAALALLREALVERG